MKLKHLVLTFTTAITLCVSGSAAAQTEMNTIESKEQGKELVTTLKALKEYGTEAALKHGEFDSRHMKEATYTAGQNDTMRAMVINGSKTRAVHVRLYRGNTLLVDKHVLPSSYYSYTEDEAMAGKYHLILDSLDSEYRGVVGLAG